MAVCWDYCVGQDLCHACSVLHASLTVIINHRFRVTNAPFFIVTWLEIFAFYIWSYSSSVTLFSHSRKKSCLATNSYALMNFIFREMQILAEFLRRTAMQDDSMTMILQRATKTSLTGLEKRRGQGTEKVNPQDQRCTGTGILGRDMAIKTQKIGTGMGTRNPLREQEMRGGEVMTDMGMEEKKDQRASGLGTTENPEAVTREGAMKTLNGMGNRGDKTWFLSGHLLPFLF